MKIGGVLIVSLRRSVFDVDSCIEYKLIRSKRRTISLQVNSDAEVIVRAPQFVSADQINDFIVEKQDWLDKKIEVKRKQLDVLQGQKRHRADEWYKEKKKLARHVFAKRIAHYEKLTGLKVSKLRLSSARTRWGSCTFNGTVSLVWRLILAPIEVIDYVVLHEIMHLKHPNHSRTFWEAVQLYMPDYKEHRLWLKENGFTLNI